MKDFILESEPRLNIEKTLTSSFFYKNDYPLRAMLRISIRVGRTVITDKTIVQKI